MRMKNDIQFFGGRGGSSGSIQSAHRRAIKQLSSPSYEDGTYNINTMKQVEYGRGYQVTFCQIGDNYSDSEYADKVSEFLKASSDGVTSAGKFESTPEISFHVNNKATAVKLAKKYNQISVWDWKNQVEIKTGGTGERR